MAFTKRYVRADAAGGLDGTSDHATDQGGGAGAFTWAEMITDINAGSKDGYHYCVKTGTYTRTTTTDTISGDGTATSPILIEGFNSTPGDLQGGGKDSNGALVTTNFPEINYTTGRLAGNGGNFIIYRNLHLTAASTAPLLQVGPSCLVASCYCLQSGTGSSSACISAGQNFITIRNCDTYNTGGVGKAITTSLATVVITGCRVNAAGCAGIEITSSTPLIEHCTIYECLNGIQCTGTSAGNFLQNTVANCTGDGISLASTSTFGLTMSGNHITGNGGYGVNFNGCTSAKQLGFNRYRDNTSGALSDTTDDWVIATATNNDVSDPGGGDAAANDALEYTDVANDNYSLLTTASAIASGPGFRNPMGAHGAGSFGGGGGGPLIGGRLVR